MAYFYKKRLTINFINDITLSKRRKKNLKNMKALKFLLLSLYIAIYTSLIWIVSVFKIELILPFLPLFVLFLVPLTIFSIFKVIDYLVKHWNDKSTGIKEIQFVLYCFLSAAYTSLWWATFVFDGIYIKYSSFSKEPDFPLGYILLSLSTVPLIIFSVIYLIMHWDSGASVKNSLN